MLHTIFLLLVICCGVSHADELSNHEFVEKLINENPKFVSAKCSPVECVLYPLDGVTSQQFKDELLFVDNLLKKNFGMSTRGDIWMPLNKGKNSLKLSWEQGIHAPLTLEEQTSLLLN